MAVAQMGCSGGKHSKNCPACDLREGFNDVSESDLLSTKTAAGRAPSQGQAPRFQGAARTHRVCPTSNTDLGFLECPLLQSSQCIQTKGQRVRFLSSQQCFPEPQPPWAQRRAWPVQEAPLPFGQPICHQKVPDMLVRSRLVSPCQSREAETKPSRQVLAWIRLHPHNTPLPQTFLLMLPLALAGTDSSVKAL